MDRDFEKLFANNWNPFASMQEALQHFTTAARDWNKVVFGNVFVRKRRTLACLEGVQKPLNVGPTQGLIFLEKNLQKELDGIL